MPRPAFWDFIRRRVPFRTLYQKLLLSHLLITLICLSVMGGFNYIATRSINNTHIVDLLQHTSNQLQSTLTTRFQQMERTSAMLQFTLYSMLNRNNSKFNQAQLATQTRNSLTSMQESFNFLNISAYLPSDFLASEEGITFHDITELDGRHRAPEVLNTPLHQLGWMAFVDYEYPFMRFSTRRHYSLLSCFSTVRTGASQQNFTYFIDLDEREIAETLSTGGETSQVSQYLIDASGTVICHPDAALLGTRLPGELVAVISGIPEGGTELYKGEQYYARTLLPSPWTLVVSVPNDYVWAQDSATILSILLAALVATSIALVTASLVSHQLTKKLRAMNAVIQSVAPSFAAPGESVAPIEQRMVVPQDTEPVDEMDKLSIVFNQMIDKLNLEMRRALMGMREQEELRYQLLQAKINPHFLYNILDSIKICNSLGRYADSSQMLEMLAQFYRLILRKSKDLISIEEELEIVRLYLEMESISHDYCFTWSIQAEEDIAMFMIPRFVLQPIVENCITHGIPGDTGKMHISIMLSYLEDNIYIEIADNGLGMSQEQLLMLNEVVRGGHPSGNRFYGLSNVYARLLPFTASDDPIRFESEAGRGTTVSIILQQTIAWEEGPDERAQTDDRG
ncbi:histidine kinase [Eubacteriales bacterium OttesenSCG-928-N13]|nr:histidine kinase [Eubacteriales bacterium OttesenSCG-928-N13]